MNLPQAQEIVKDHIRIGKGMELTNGVPEALEMVVEELAVTQKALELACKFIGEYNPGLSCEPVRDMAYWLHKAQSKAGQKTPKPRGHDDVFGTYNGGGI